MSEEKENQLAVIELESPVDQTQYEADFDEVKQSLYDIVMTSKTSLDELASLAKSSQHPDAFKALAGLVRAINESHATINNVLVNKYESKKIIDKLPAETQKLENHNHLHVSSTEFLQMVKKAKE